MLYTIKKKLYVKKMEYYKKNYIFARIISPNANEKSFSSVFFDSNIP